MFDRIAAGSKVIGANNGYSLVLRCQLSSRPAKRSATICLEKTANLAVRTVGGQAQLLALPLLQPVVDRAVGLVDSWRALVAS